MWKYSGTSKSEKPFPPIDMKGKGKRTALSEPGKRWSRGREDAVTEEERSSHFQKHEMNRVGKIIQDGGWHFGVWDPNPQRGIAHVAHGQNCDSNYSLWYGYFGNAMTCFINQRHGRVSNSVAKVLGSFKQLLSMSIHV